MLKSGSELKASFQSNGKAYSYYSLPELDKRSGGKVSRLPYSLRVLLENLLRYEDGGDTVSAEDIQGVVDWDAKAAPSREIAFRPARVLLQDFTGVPAVVDLAAMRDAMGEMGGDPNKINPLQQADLVIDHSVQVDEYGSAAAQLLNVEKEYERNRERYAFLRWGQGAFNNFSVVPPGTGIVHQVNLEYLAKVAYPMESDGGTVVYPDSLVGTDSHTTMVNGLGVLGWGVGGIEAEAAMLGQPISMLVPQVVGFKLKGKLPAGATATDLVLTATQMLRSKGVVGKFVEYYGEGMAALSLADRATLANMAPEYGATMGFFPVDERALEYMRLTGRSEEQVQLTEDYFKAAGLFHDADSPEPVFSDSLELDLSTVEPSLAGPKRPQDRVLLSGAKAAYRRAVVEIIGDHNFKQERKQAVADWVGEGGNLDPEASADKDGHDDETPREHEGEHPLGPLGRRVHVEKNGSSFDLKHGDVVIAAITSCTNTSNPSVLVAAGLLAKKAAAKGLLPKPWVKTSLAPGSKVVTEYLRDSGLLPELEKLGFHVVGYGCTTCIGNSGPLPPAISKAIHEGDLVAASVLSGNRNFEGRVNPDVRANYLASPPLVVAYALAGTLNKNLAKEPLGTGSDGKPVFLADIWPSSEEIQQVVGEFVTRKMFQEQYSSVFDGDEAWRGLPVPEGDRYAWDKDSLYVRNPPYFEGMPAQPGAVEDITGARVLAKLGDSVTTDHISPAGSIAKDSPAGKYLMENGVEPKDFNSYGSRRGNHEVMMRGTFANIRLRNQLAPGTEGGWTRHQPSGEQMFIYDAAMKYKAAGVPSIVLAGKEYGTGSSRDWAGKGPALLGIRAAIAQSYERIHRSNLIGMGVLPLQFPEGEGADSLGLDGTEEYSITGLAGGVKPGMKALVTAKAANGEETTFEALVRIDTPNEAEYYRHGGILKYVLRQLLAK